MNRRRALMAIAGIPQYRQQLFNNIFHTSVPDFVDNKKVRNQGTAKLVSLIGNGEIENQYVHDLIATTTVSDVTITNNNDGSFTFNGTASANISINLCSSVLGLSGITNHVFLITQPQGASANFYVRTTTGGLYTYDNVKNGIATAIENGINYLQLIVSSGTQINNVRFVPLLVNLTQRYGTGKEPTNINDPRIKRILANKNPFNTGTYKSTIIDEIAFEGFNMFDEETTDGFWDTNGANTNSSFIRNSHAIPVIEGMTYYIKAPTTAGSLYTKFYADETFTNGFMPIVITKNNTFVVPQGAKYFGFSFQKSSYGNVYNHDICVYKANNVWNEQVELGELDAQGQDVVNTSKLRSVGYTSISPNKPYYFSIPSGFNFYICFYDANKNFITSSNANSFTTPNNARYLRFNLASTYGTTYNGDINIFEVRGYAPFISPFMPRFYVPFVAGSIKNSFKATSGGYIFDKKVGVVDLGQCEWTLWDNAGIYRTTDIPTKGNQQVGNIKCDLYTPVSFGTMYAVSTAPNMSMAVYNAGDGYLYIKNTSYSNDPTAFKQAMSGVMLYFELATSQTITIPCNKMNLVDLGSLSWQKSGTTNGFYVQLADLIYTKVGEAYCDKYDCKTASITASSIQNYPNQICQNSSNDYIYFYSSDTASMTTSEFAQFMSGTYLYYETQNSLNEFTNNVLEKTMAIQLQAPIQLDGALDSHNTFEVTKDEYVFTRNVWNYTFTGNEVWTWFSSYSLFVMKKYDNSNFPNCKNNAYGVQSTLCNKKYVSNNKSNWTWDDNTIGVGTSFISSDNRSIVVRDDSFNGDTTTFKSSLTDKTITYELATPQVIRIPRKRMKAVRLDQLSWNRTGVSGYYVFYAQNSTQLINNLNNYCSAFLSYNNDVSVSMPDKSITGKGGVGTYVWVRDDSCATVNDFLAKHGNEIIFFETQDEVEDFLVDKNTLPDDYQKVEYIESTGTQYVDTGVIPTNQTVWELDAQFSNTSSIQYNGRFDNDVSSQGQRFDIASSSNSGYFILNGGNTLVTTKAIDTLRHKFVIDMPNGKGKIDTNEYNLNTQNLSSSRSVYLFARNSFDIEYYCSEKVYGCKFYDNGTLVRNFIPCYKKSTGEIGLFDLVTRQFFTNQGTGTFLKGNDVIEYKNEAIFQRGGTFTTNEFEWVENQLVTNGNFATSGSWSNYTNTYTTASISNNKMSVQVIDNSASYFYQYGVYQTMTTNAIPNHKYLIFVNATSTKFSSFRTDVFGGNKGFDAGGSAFIWDNTTNVTTATIIIGPVLTAITVAVGDAYDVNEVWVTDLTVGFGAGKEPSSINDWRIQFILKYGYIPTNAQGTYKVVNSEVLANAILKLQVK